jgi:hypothetical protein
VRSDHPDDGGDEVAELVGGGLEPQAKTRAHRDAVLEAEVLDLAAHEVGVRDREDAAVDGPDPRRAQADRVDDADAVAEPEDVAHPDRAVGVEDQPPDEVLERALRGEGHREAAHAEAGHEGGNRQAERLGGDEEIAGHGEDGQDPERDADELSVEGLLRGAEEPEDEGGQAGERDRDQPGHGQVRDRGGRAAGRRSGWRRETAPRSAARRSAPPPGPAGRAGAGSSRRTREPARAWPG